MLKITLLLVLLSLQLPSFSQVVAHFEEFNLQPGQYLNDASPSKGFESGSIVLPNEYNAEFNFWSGFAISADTNTTTPGFTNQYSAYPGRGAEGTTTYAMGYIYEPILDTQLAFGHPSHRFHGLHHISWKFCPHIECVAH